MNDAPKTFDEVKSSLDRGSLRVWEHGPGVRIPRLMYEQGLEDCEAILGTRDLSAWIEEEVRRGLKKDDTTETPPGWIAQKACPSCGGGRCRTYRISATEAWQGHVPQAADIEGKYHDECDDCGYQSKIRSKP